MTKRSEPEWWAEVRRLRAEGWKCLALAAQFNVHESSIQYILHEEVRERSRLHSQARYRRMTPAARAKKNAARRRRYDQAKHRFDEQIIAAAADALRKWDEGDTPILTWEQLSESERDYWITGATLVLEAASYTHHRLKGEEKISDKRKKVLDTSGEGG